MRNRTEESLWHVVSYGGTAVVLGGVGLSFLVTGEFGLFIPIGMIVFALVFMGAAYGSWKDYRIEQAIDDRLRERYRRSPRDVDPEEPLKWREHPPLIKED